MLTINVANTIVILLNPFHLTNSFLLLFSRFCFLHFWILLPCLSNSLLTESATVIAVVNTPITILYIGKKYMHIISLNNQFHNQKHPQVSTWECSYFTPIQLPKQPYLSTALYCYNHMYRTLADSKMFRCLTHRRIIINNISGYFHSSFLNIGFHKKSPAILVFTLYAGNFCSWQ